MHVIILVTSVLALVLLGALARRKNVDIIVLGSIKRRPPRCDGKRHVFFCFVDHFEPMWKGADENSALERVRMWLSRYPVVTAGLEDGGGRPPQHTFFYPEEEYHPQCLDMLAELRRKGLGDVEIHLHHDNDTSESLREKLQNFKGVLRRRHGLLRENPRTGEIEYGFIHGNWALDDSGPGGRYCGVRDEITILEETGCYADFTFPSAPHPTQPPMINVIYYATDDPVKAKSHHRGREVVFGRHTGGDLLMITGPLAVNWRLRRRGIFPAIENGDVTSINPPVPARIDLWVKTAIGVRGWPGWIFIKVHTHGAQEANSSFLLGEGIKMLHEHLAGRYNDGRNYVLHYVTSWETANCVRILEKGDREGISLVEAFDYDAAWNRI
jgi:hypothetical protein